MSPHGRCDKQARGLDRRRDRSCAAPGRPAAIWAKMNSLVDPAIIEKLYRGQQCGRGGRSDRSRHLLPAARCAGHVRAYPRQVGQSADSWSTAASSGLRQWRGAPKQPRAGVHQVRRLDAAQFRPPGRIYAADREPRPCTIRFWTRCCSPICSTMSRAGRWAPMGAPRASSPGTSRLTSTNIS